jgi:AraC-like DNA-binding protein
MEYKMLNNGVEMPMVGLGVYNISRRETQRVVETAIEVGYRSIDTAGNTIRRFVMKRAQQLLFSGCSVSQTADQLGFDYPQHFTRMFKKCYGMSPSDYLKQMRSK